MATPTELFCFYAAAGTAGLLALIMHITLHAALHTGPLHRIAHVRRLWWSFVAAAFIAVAARLAIQPAPGTDFESASAGFAFPVIALAGLIGVALCNEPGAEVLAWVSSCALLSGGLATVAIVSGAGLVWWASGVVLTASYMVATGMGFAQAGRTAPQIPSTQVR
jgi:hypothetical protein